MKYLIIITLLTALPGITLVGVPPVQAQDNIWIKQPIQQAQPAYNPYIPQAQVYQPSRQMEQVIIEQKRLENQILERQIYKTPDWIDPHVPRYNQNQQPVIVIGD